MSMVGFNVGRCEHKYLVPEETAVALRSFVKAYLGPDQYMPTNEAEGYHVHSLYLDSPMYGLYQETKDGVKNRYKLRIRFYDDAPDAPAFLEIKTRTTDSIRKLRATVSKQSAEKLLRGAHLSPRDLIGASEKSTIALEEFCNRTAFLLARGSAFVSYRREAYVAQETEGIRITFDRHITGLPFDPVQGLKLPTDGASVFPDKVVVELKYAGQLPVWIRSLVRDFGLHRISFPKYVHAVDALRFKPPMASDKQLSSENLPDSQSMQGVAC
jgi:SPX domain protein involved in polyphosphate accumulation